MPKTGVITAEPPHHPGQLIDVTWCDLLSSMLDCNCCINVHWKSILYNTLYNLWASLICVVFKGVVLACMGQVKFTWSRPWLIALLYKCGGTNNGNNNSVNPVITKAPWFLPVLIFLCLDFLMELWKIPIWHLHTYMLNPILLLLESVHIQSTWQIISSWHFVYIGKNHSVYPDKIIAASLWKAFT